MQDANNKTSHYLNSAFLTHFIKEDFIQYIKSFSAIASLLGLALLVWYFADNNVPFPINLSTLPILLLVIAFVGLCSFCLLFCMFFMPLYLPFIERSPQFNEEQYSFKQLYTDTKQLRLYIRMHGFATLAILLCVITTFMAQQLNSATPWMLFSLYVVVCTISTLLAHSQCQQSLACINLGRLGASVAVILISSFWSLVVMTICITSISQSEFANYTTDNEQLDIFIVLLVTLGLAVSLVAFNYFIIRLGYEQAFPKIIFVVLLSMSVLFLMPNTAPFFGKLTLRVLNIGGNTFTCYVFDQQALQKINQRAIGSKNFSKPLYKVFDNGLDVFVRIKADDDHVFSITKKYIISEMHISHSNKTSIDDCATP